MAPRGTQLSHLASCQVPVCVETDPHSSCSGLNQRPTRTCAFDSLPAVAAGVKFDVSGQEIRNPSGRLIQKRNNIKSLGEEAEGRGHRIAETKIIIYYVCMHYEHLQ